MNHLCKNTISKKPEAIFFGELEISLQSSIVDPLVFTVEYDGEYGELGTALHEYLNNNLSCTDIKHENVGRNFDLEVIHSNHVTPASEVESDIYYYHTDHLGSSSWITYTDGSVTQHLQNLPFGEPFIDQRTTEYDIRYKFTGKEMDTETGYQYFGARYYNSDISVWLSVDPLADKLPYISSYVYSLNKPIIYKDPDGRFPWLTGLAGAGVNIAVGYISAKISGEKYSGKDALIDGSIGFAVASGAALIAPLIGVSTVTSTGGKLLYGGVSGAISGMATNGLKQLSNIFTGAQESWDNSAFLVSGFAGVFAGSASAGMGITAQKFMHKLGDKMFKNFTKNELRRYTKIQTKYLKSRIEQQTGAKVSKRQLNREVSKAINNWKDIKATEIEGFKVTTKFVSEESTKISITIGSAELIKNDK